MFLKLLLICAWLESTVLTAVSGCVVKYKNQTNICPNNNTLYNKELHALAYPSSYTQFLTWPLKYIHE